MLKRNLGRYCLGFHPVDVHVGIRLRQRRALLGMSQTALGNAVGLTFQQVQKYEQGSNHIGSSRLFEFAMVLDVPVTHFFDGVTPEAAKGKRNARRPETKMSNETAINTKRETLELVRAYYKIGNKGVRQHIRDMVQSLASKD
jgi:transcriptional regulator with XRE-family HTH domain